MGRYIVGLTLSLALGLLGPSAAFAQSATLAQCAQFSQAQNVIYLTWDRTGVQAAQPCAAWDGFTLTDPAAVEAHEIYGYTMQPSATDGLAAIWACTESWGADGIHDPPAGIQVVIPGAQALHAEWDTWLVRHYGAPPCSWLLATFGNRPPYSYMQAW